MGRLTKKKEPSSSSRDALFGSSAANPYATNGPADDPYVDSGSAAPPPPYSGGPSADRFRQEKSAAGMPGQLQPGPQSGGYGGGPPDRFGAAGQARGGYGGGDRFAAQQPPPDRFAAQQPPPDRYAAQQPPPDRYGGGGEQRDRFAPGRPDPFAGGRQDGPPAGAPAGGQQDRFRGPQPAVMQNRGGGLPERPAPTNRFGAPPPAAAPPAGDKFGAGTYGNPGGFGQDRYGGPPQPAAESRYGSGGYGNYGGKSGPSTNPAAREMLFAGARPLDQVPPPGMPPADPTNDWESGRGENYGSGNYESYDQRQLTAEEQEEEDITGAKQEIRFIKQQDVSSTRNALRLAAQAEETARGTLERIGAQGESIHATEKNLDLASNQNRLAAEKARELKTLNRSMWAMHVGNPFTSQRRIREKEDKVLEDAQRDREEREALRIAAWGSSARSSEMAKDMDKMSRTSTKTKASLAERAKYQFEADSEDEQLEDEIDSNLDMLHGAAKRLNHLAQGMGREVDVQNKHLDRIGGKVDRVDDEIALNRSRLDRIK